MIFSKYFLHNCLKLLTKYTPNLSLREKCPYSEFLFSKFSRIWTKYRKILRISPYSVRMWENTDQKNSEYGSPILNHETTQNDLKRSKTTQSKSKRPKTTINKIHSDPKQVKTTQNDPK